MCVYIYISMKFMEIYTYIYIYICILGGSGNLVLISNCDQGNPTYNVVNLYKADLGVCKKAFYAQLQVVTRSHEPPIVNWGYRQKFGV